MDIGANMRFYKTDEDIVTLHRLPGTLADIMRVECMVKKLSETLKVEINWRYFEVEAICVI